MATMAKNNPPSIKETAFDCPHCGAYTTQSWINLHGTWRDEKDRTPFIPQNEFAERMKEATIPDDRKEKFLAYLEKLGTGLISFEK